MTVFDRLMAEALPTGTFGHAEPARARAADAAPRWTPAEQAQHVAALEAELDRLEGRGTGKPQLRLVDRDAA
ncbi:hypothetical protein ABZ791_30350 [Streptomyces huasconensis]|uniref:Uncharacterized protein n=1 Tax=Streptomyces huasconensis TaxID=1854574 RepID=A0ABV3M1P3_9ACTN